MLQYTTYLDGVSRRAALKASSCGFGYLAFAGLAAAESTAAKSPLAPKAPHFPATAKRVIFLSMAGGPSHVDTFDHKPKLNSDDGQSPPVGNRRGAKLLGSPWSFKKHGQAGTWMSELLPNLAERADDLCVLNGMHTNVPAHPQAFLMMHTGSFQFVRPSLGAWTLYGLGTENANLPGFVSLSPPSTFGGAQNYGSSFLPAVYQGTKIGGTGSYFAGRRGGAASTAVPNIANPKLGPDGQRAQVDFIQELNKSQIEQDGVNRQVEGVIQSYELAFRMQADLPKVLDVSSETKETQALYGIGDDGTDNFGRQCLLARRLAEAGVRFVELTYGNWDQHRNLRTDLERHTTAIDKPIAGLLADLKRRGMLDDTLVVWSGEFGRTPYAQGTDGRDHNHKGYTTWMAGGGVKAGHVHGKTDDYGYEAIDGKVHVHDLHATILRLLGLDHEKLTFNYAGRDFRLTDVHGNVVSEVIA